MLSSTSSSDAALPLPTPARPAGTSLALLLSFVIVVLTGLELTTRFVVVRMSNTERRFTGEYQAALSAGRDKSRPTVLLVGNSLLFEDVLPGPFQAAMAPAVDARVFPVYQTMYYDWYYGLRNLFEHGSRPTVVGLVIARWHLTSDFIRGPYTAHRLLGVRDLIDLSGELDLHPTQLSSYLAAHLSAFYGLRTEVRSNVLKLVVPGVDNLAPVFGGFAPFVETTRPTPAVDLFPAARDRLIKLRDLSSSYGARFILVLPPVGPDRRQLDADDPVRRAAAAAGVQAVETASLDSYPETAFRDGLHMNEMGARRYTTELADALRTIAAVRR